MSGRESEGGEGGLNRRKEGSTSAYQQIRLTDQNVGRLHLTVRKMKQRGVGRKVNGKQREGESDLNLCSIPSCRKIKFTKESESALTNKTVRTKEAK